MPESPDFELLPPIPGHAHSIDAWGRPTCGCTLRPDFEQIARRLLVLDQENKIGDELDTFGREIAEQLRLVWNARGAADAQAVEDRIRELVAGEIVGAGIARHVAEAIRTVDR